MARSFVIGKTMRSSVEDGLPVICSKTRLPQTHGFCDDVALLHFFVTEIVQLLNLLNAKRAGIFTTQRVSIHERLGANVPAAIGIQ